ncbi:MAG: tetratricopeptide repeat protein, partial [Proteobacteria bacterium]|nr:tetratricopeptide repeat protein [Pseudomonadota bacterium]
MLCLLMVLSACQPRTEAEFFKKAEVYAEKGRFEKAVETYQKYLADFPEGERRDKALFRSGEILYYALGQRAPAVRNFDLLVRKYPASASAFRAREILAGVFRDEVQDYKRAAIEYRCLLEQQPESPKAPGYQLQIARC